MSELEKSVDSWVEELTHDINPEHFNHNENFISYLHDEKIHSFGNWMWDNGYNVGLYNLQTKINTYCIPQWISVKDRLPEEGVNVLVYGKICHNKNGIETDFVKNGNFVACGEDVTHWAYLPEPPKEDDAE